MLPKISKLLLVVIQIIASTTLTNIILLSNSCCHVRSLPITSKPIESTAENLAWEAWLMVPVGQQQKSRKVTPKSIFIVPHKNNQTTMCPPGEHWSQNRCIPTVNIDPDKALLNQLSHLAPLSLDYDYDYEEDGSLSPTVEKLEGSADTNPYSGGDFVDEPLKFNIFSETFPIGSSGSGDSSGSKDSDDENIFYVSERRRRPPAPSEISLPDLDTESSHYGPNNDSDNEDMKNPMFLSGIDAILVPVVSSDNQKKDHNMTFSIYRETLNSTPSTQAYHAEDGRDHELEEILENESLILEKNAATSTTIITPTGTTTEANAVKSSSSLNWETTTMKLEEEYEDTDSKTEFTRSVTDLPPIDEETSQPTIFDKHITSTIIIPKDDTSTITESKEDITTITSPKEEITTLEITSSSISTTTDEITTTTDLPPENEQTTSFDLEKNNSPIDDQSKDQQLNEDLDLPSVISIVEELRKINDLVAKNTRQTTSNPSEEGISNTNDLLSKITSPSNTIKSSSEDPLPLSSTSTVWSSNSTSRIILSKNSSSSSSNTISSTEQSQESISEDPLSSTTSQKPEITEPDPYWWLPRTWSSSERTETDRPLLLRFWSALSGISGSQTKV